MDDRILTAVNGFARATPWLYGFMLGYAGHGVVLFVALPVAGWWTALRNGEGMAAALWAPPATVLAVAVNQPIVAAVREPRPQATSSAQTMPPG